MVFSQVFIEVPKLQKKTKPIVLSEDPKIGWFGSSRGSLGTTPSEIRQGGTGPHTFTLSHNWNWR